jgi:pimeloyl-ACP methyl ester carboxylesterase
MRNIANDPALVGEVTADRRGGGGRRSLDDRWTPLSISMPFSNRIASPKSLVVLEGCGHFPVEEPGLSQMLEAVVELRNRVPAD